VRSTDGRFYTEYGVVAADFTGDTKETLQVMLNYSAENYDRTVEYEVSSYKNWWAKLCGTKTWTTVTEAENFSLDAYTFMAAVEGELEEVVDSTTNTVTGYNFDMNVRTTLVDFVTSFCKLNSDNDTSYISYTSEHGIIYSDPEVLSVLASAPYFEDLSSDELSGSYMESSTSYSSTEGEGSETTTSNTLSVGAYVSYEHDFEALGVKVGSLETELSYTHGWTWETSNSSMTEMTISYETVVGQDSVVFYSIPMEYYIYDSYVPIIDEDTGEVTGYDQQKMSVNIPHTAAVLVLALDKYENIAADYTELPTISGTVLTHSLGDPSTYPTSSSGYNNAIEFDGNFAGVDFSDVGASVSQEINITSENGSGFTNTNSVDFSIGAGPGSFVFGISAGYEYGSSKVTITSTGSTYSGTIYNMPLEAEDYGYYYAWKLFAYTYTIGDSKIPVVNYLVNDVTAPPSLPEDFAQDSTLTTDEEVGLTWSYSSAKAISGFQIYRYYEFSDGSGSYELAFINALDVSYTTVDSDDTVIRHYKYIDDGLAEYNDYDYQIQVVRAAVPTSSIVSDVLTAKTKTSKGYPTVTLSGVTSNVTNTYDSDTGDLEDTVTDYSLLVYPDTSTTVSVSVEEEYDETPRYQWQKLTDEGWENVSDATKASYTFKNSGISDEGEYRCRLNVIYEDIEIGKIYYISAYSDSFTLNYSMRTPKLVEDSFTANIQDETVSLSLKSAHTNHTFAPSGNVTFNITGVDYETSYTVALGTANDNYETTATLDLGSSDSDGDGVIVNLPEGVYEISAYYAGSRTFGSLEVSDSTYYVSGSGSGYMLNVDSSFTYGETIEPKLMNISTVGSSISASQIDDNVIYKVYEEQLVSHTYTYTVSYFWGLYEQTYTNTYWTYENVERSDFSQSGGSILAKDVGSFDLKAYEDGNEVASRTITIDQMDISIGFKNELIGESGDISVSHPTYDNLELVSDNQFVEGDSFENLGIEVKAYDTAGKEVTISSSTDPGYYTIIGAVSDTPGTNYANYNITYISSSYILTGPKYDMSIESEKYGINNDIVGTIKIASPEITDDNGNVISTTSTTATNNILIFEDVFTGGTYVIFKATPQTGYKVKSWIIKTDNKETTYDTSSTTLAYETTANDTTVTVEYELSQNQLYFKSANSSLNDGTVTPVGNSIQSGAVVQPGAEYTFIATPADGYHFVEWTLISISNSNFDGDYDEETGTSTTTLTMEDADPTILSAVFERDSYELDLQSNLQVKYSADDGFGNIEEMTSYGTETILGGTSVTITPKTGYSLTDEAVWSINGVSVGTVNEVGQSYTFTLTADTTVEVGTSQNSYNVSVLVSQPEATICNTVTVKANNATADFTNAQSVSGGTSLTFNAVAAWGYVFDKWIVNEVDEEDTGDILTVSELGEDTSVEAVFVENPNSYIVNVSNNSGGDLTYSINYNESGYSGNAPTNASVDSSGTQITAYEGDTCIITATPDSDYMLRSWTVGDTVDESPEEVLTLEEISSDITLSARFIPMSFTKVTYTAEDGGSITSAVSDDVEFASGDTIGNGTELVITAVPDTGNMISKWTFDGEIVMNSDGTTFVGEILTIDSLSAGNSAEIKVYFSSMTEYMVDYDLTNVEIQKTYSPSTYTGQTASTETEDFIQSGTKVTIIAAPEDGYRMTFLTVNGEDCTKNDDGTWSYTNNNVLDDLKVVATASKLYTVLTDSNIDNGSIAIVTEIENGKAIAGETITLIDINPDLDYTFDGWFYNNTTASGIEFKMPAENTTVSANFTAVDPVNISYSVHDTNGINAGGLNGSVSAEVNRTYSVSGYPVYDSEGSITVSRGYSDQYVSWPDSIITFNAEPNSGYMAKYWYIDGVEVTDETANCTINSNALAMTIVQESASNYDIQVQYDQIGDKITYYSEDTHGSIIESILTSKYGESTNISSGDTLTIDGTIKFTAIPVSDDYQVEGWYVNGIKQEDETSTVYNYVATAGIGANITVSFERVSYMVAFTGVNGNVTAKMNNVSIGSSAASVVGDSEVTFIATANSGYAFYNWTVNGEISDVDINILELSITNHTVVKANFIEDENCTITYGVAGDGGTLTALKDENEFADGDSAAANDVIIFTAVPETVANNGSNNYRVASWTVGDITIITHDTTRELIVSEGTSVFVTFERYDYVVDYGVTDDENGEITAFSDSVEIDRLDRVYGGSDVVFTAYPATGYQVKSWTVDDITEITENTTYTVENINADMIVKVEFEEVASYTITITTSGTGYGSVTAKVEDGDSISKATSVTVLRHGTVKFTAMRYDTNNAFNGWTVTGEESCTPTYDGIVLTLSDVTDDITIDASFKPATMVELSASESDEYGTLDLTQVKTGYLSADLMNEVDLSASSSMQITSGMDVVIKAIPATDYMVKEWIVNGEVQDELSKTLVLKGVNVDTNIQVTFEPIVKYSIPSSGNYYTVTPGLKIPDDVGSDDEIRDRGTVTFTVDAEDGFYIGELEICDLDCLSETNDKVSATTNDNGNSYEITVNNVTEEIEYNIKAIKPVVNISAITNGTINITYVENDEIKIVESGDEIGVGTELTITAIPDSGYYFKSWTDDAVGMTETEINLTVVEVENITISAEFVQPTVIIYIPENGKIVVTYVDESEQKIILADTSTSEEGEKNVKFLIPVGTYLTITETPDSGYSLKKWGGEASGKSGAEITLYVPSNDISIYATFYIPSSESVSGGTSGGTTIPDSQEQISTQTVTNSDGSLTITTKIETSVTVSGNSAVAIVEKETLETLIAQVKASENEALLSGKFTSSIVMNAVVQDDIGEIAVEVPITTLKSIIDETSASMKIVTKTTEVILDQKALSAISGDESEGTVTITVKEIDKTTLSEEVQKIIGDAYVLDLQVTNSAGTVSDLAGGTATVRVTVPELMIGRNMKVVYIADDGTVTNVMGTKITIEGVEYYEFTTGHFSYYALVEDNDLHFTDVAEDSWYYNAVAYVYRNNLMSGTSSKIFDPNATTNRGMFVTVLWRLAGEPASEISIFKDVDNGTWYSQAVSWAAGNSIVNGMSSSLFAPDSSITREQMAVILYKYAEFKGYDVSTRGDITKFEDNEKISSWATDAIAWAVGSNIISGKGNEMLDPTGSATRAEIATILMKFIQD
jgi:hypothetical protein